MKLVTACPACATKFVLSQDQLNINRGKVRCGHCDQVFDGYQTLYKLVAAPAQTLAFADEILANAPNEIETAILTNLNKEPSESASKDSAVKLFDVVEVVATPYELADMPLIEPTVEPTVEAPHIADYFLGASKLKPLPPKKPYRWLLILVVVALFLLGLGQALYYFKNIIATQLPQTKPNLIQACNLIGCKIELPMQLESLAIDDSEMREDAEHEHVLLFSITLANKANIALRYPSIELTLTNVDDETVIRRTFSPQEYMKASGDLRNIEAGLSAKANLAIKLALNTNNLAVTGYKLALIK